MNSPSSTFPADVPLEMLHEIVEQFVFGINDRWSDIVHSKEVAALVCRRWRDAAVGNPRLWSDITVHRYTRPSYLKTCLARAKSVDVTLRLDCTPTDRARVGCTVVSVQCRDIAAFTTVTLKPLGYHFRRMRGISIITPTRDGMMEVVRALSRFPLPPNVRWLTTRVSQQQMQPVIDLPWTGNTFRPEAMEVFAMVPVWSNPAAFSRLKVLRLSGISSGVQYEWAHLVSVLRACPGLWMLQVEAIHCAEVGGAHKVTMPNLSEFELHASSDDGAGFVRFMDMPAIRSLRIHLSQLASISSIALLSRSTFSRASNVQLGIPAATLSQLKAVVPLLTSVHTLDLRDCEPGVAWLLSGIFADPDVRLPQAEKLYVNDVLSTDLIQQLLHHCASDCVVISREGYGFLDRSIESRLENGRLAQREL